MYGAVLRYNIENEKHGRDYSYSPSDKKLLKKMFREINRSLGTHIRYLAEMDAFIYHGSGEIVAQYIKQFETESVRAILLAQIIADKIPDCDLLTYELYMHFKCSDSYISQPFKPSPLHITGSYDNAFRRLNPRRLKAELLELARSPRDAEYLPLTMRMLASWRVPQMHDVLLSYADSDRLTSEDVGLDPNDDRRRAPTLETIKRNLKFTAIAGLKYYTTSEAKSVLNRFSAYDDKDFCEAAEKSLAFMAKHDKMAKKLSLLLKMSIGTCYYICRIIAIYYVTCRMDGH